MKLERKLGPKRSYKGDNYAELEIFFRYMNYKMSSLEFSIESSEKVTFSNVVLLSADGIEKYC